MHADNSAPFGVYVHIPYCLQICTYCDFVKFEVGDLPPMERYIELLREEIRSRSSSFTSTPLSSLYWGGGTPSLMKPQDMVAVHDELASAGFHPTSNTEITLEINPGTLGPQDEAGRTTEDQVLAWLDAGVTRFSVGAQTFNADLLKVTGRKHSVADTHRDLQLLKSKDLNFNFDLLFGLPGQKLRDLELDLEQALSYGPRHLSAYCLTVPERHPLNQGRASDEEQADMFELIEDRLKSAGLIRYELSNFAWPGFESRHNLLYWSDRPYWGLGMGSHSFRPRTPGSVDFWGLRFWNPATLKAYEKELALASGLEFWQSMPRERVEMLLPHEALTDYLHTHLRVQRGLDIERVAEKFGAPVAEDVTRRLAPCVEEGLLRTRTLQDRINYHFSSRGHALANRVLERLTYLKDEWPGPRSNGGRPPQL